MAPHANGRWNVGTGNVMYQRRSPNLEHLVRNAMNRYPAEWEAARERPDGSRDDRFIRLLAWDASKHDPNIGLNGKRGSDVISTDALAYKNPTAPGGAEVIDVIVGSTHTPSWQDATKPPCPHPQCDPDVPEGVLGKYIAPTDPGGTLPPEPPSEPPSTDLEARIAALEAGLRATDAKANHAVQTAGGAYERAGQAVDLTALLAERISRLKVKGTIDLPIVIEWLARRGRAKGEVELPVKE